MNKNLLNFLQEINYNFTLLLFITISLTSVFCITLLTYVLEYEEKYGNEHRIQMELKFLYSFYDDNIDEKSCCFENVAIKDTIKVSCKKLLKETDKSVLCKGEIIKINPTINTLFTNYISSNDGYSYYKKLIDGYHSYALFDNVIRSFGHFLAALLALLSSFLVVKTEEHNLKHINDAHIFDNFRTIMTIIMLLILICSFIINFCNTIIVQ